MAGRIPVLKCLVFITVLYSVTLTVVFLSANPSSPSSPKGDSYAYQRTAVSNNHIRNNPEPKDDGYVFKSGSDMPSHDRGDNPTWGPHKLAVIVPYRDRLEELLEFAPHLHEYLVKKKVRHKIIIVNQVDTLRFNRGSLINIGVLESDPECDYIAMHDVDLLPLSEELDYSFPELGPFHIAAPDLHPLYHYPTFIGGILLITKKHFAQVNGLSNRYYGWGREDDEFYVRLKQSGLLKSYFTEVDGKDEQKFEIRRPQNISTGLNTFRHIHEKQRRPRDNARYFGQKEKTSRLDKETGVMSVKYDLLKSHHLVINGAPLTMLEVKLQCDFVKTPWCLKKEDHYLLKDIMIPPNPDTRAP